MGERRDNAGPPCEERRNLNSTSRRFCSAALLHLDVNPLRTPILVSKRRGKCGLVGHLLDGVRYAREEEERSWMVVMYVVVVGKRK